MCLQVYIKYIVYLIREEKKNDLKYEILNDKYIQKYFFRRMCHYELYTETSNKTPKTISKT